MLFTGDHIIGADSVSMIMIRNDLDLLHRLPSIHKEPPKGEGSCREV
jgi:hypothetical protein